MPVHHWIKWYKFGFTRTWDNLSQEIRLGKLSRQDAIKKIKEIGNEEPKDAIIKYCDFIEISTKEFYKICNSFRGKDIWSYESGKYYIENFLIKDWNWDEV